MDRGAEITLEEEAPVIGQASRMHLKEDLRRIRCAVLLCLLAVLLLALPTAYLLVGNLRAPTSCSGQVTDERSSHFLKQRAVATVTDTIPSAEKPRAHLTGNACSIPKRSPRALQLLQCKNLSLYGSDRIRCCKKQRRNSHRLCLAQHCRFNTAVSVGKGP